MCALRFVPRYLITPHARRPHHWGSSKVSKKNKRGGERDSGYKTLLHHIKGATWWVVENEVMENELKTWEKRRALPYIASSNNPTPKLEKSGKTPDSLPSFGGAKNCAEWRKDAFGVYLFLCLIQLAKIPGKEGAEEKDARGAGLLRFNTILLPFTPSAAISSPVRNELHGKRNGVVIAALQKSNQHSGGHELGPDASL